MSRTLQDKYPFLNMHTLVLSQKNLHHQAVLLYKKEHHSIKVYYLILECIILHRT